MMDMKLDVKQRFFVIFSLIGFLSTWLFYSPTLTFHWQFVWLILYIGLHLFFFPKIPKIVEKISINRVIFSLLLAAEWVYSSHRFAFSSLGIKMWIVTCLTFLMFTLSTYCVLFWLEEAFSEQGRSKWVWGVLYGAIPAVVWFIYFMVYAPGKMTYDSFWQWDMAHHLMPYNAWHPVLHTWLIQATTWVYDSPASYSLFQIVFVSVIVGYALYSLQSFGVPFIWVILLDLVYALNPVNGFYMVTMWKDIPFSACLLLLTVFFSKIVLTNGEWLRKNINGFLFVLVAFLAMNLRDNGSAVILASLVLLIVFARGIRIRLTLLTIPVIICYVLFNGPLMHAVHVIKNPLNQALAIPSQQIAATYKHHGTFTPHLRTYFDQILPAKNWRKDYQTNTVNPIKHDPSYDASVINKSFSTYIKNWALLLVHNPKTFVQAYLYQVSSIWQFQTPKGMNPYFTTGINLQDYPAGIKLNAPTKVWKLPRDQMLKAAYAHYKEQIQVASPQLSVMPYSAYEKRAVQTLHLLRSKSMLPQLKPAFQAIFYGVDHTLDNYFLKGAIPLFFLLLSAVAAFRRWRFKGLALIFPPLFVVITIAMAMPAPDYRYSFSFAFTVPYLFLLSKVKGEPVH